MTETELDPKFVAVCQSCETMTVSKEAADGSIRPLAVPENCTCGDGEFRRLRRDD
ncbi:hypothetical protein OB955_21480 [Halobacteria archaeon AArc-m2/3/4]|uniref:Uncharacterized protein n=1 Tax=Natronoglomus mannanivorans TaxID=2979990 RepID=A0AAP2YZV1_9EURY|nr:hypothetical protein [Halobacteria archaeon AArc-xg1-1]MCU4975277.1 hypothetical protein [Halobacteria archaeon AArc-m2/3/4]